MTLVFQMYECRSLTSSSACAANLLDEYLPTIIGPHGPIDRRNEKGDHPRSQPQWKTVQVSQVSMGAGAEEAFRRKRPELTFGHVAPECRVFPVLLPLLCLAHSFASGRSRSRPMGFHLCGVRGVEPTRLLELFAGWESLVFWSSRYTGWRNENQTRHVLGVSDGVCRSQVST